ncbi:hypothetical protein L2E82_07461 [Cichorium intybus]|uniref:Uncharacterized protein n=1 Tax=Cichorium intybus TaxID=13427 RepID=A0ACB9G5E2_CICIN|nr:hypothetical protein L2E82_07461 [Cichorium intybus]
MDPSFPNSFNLNFDGSQNYPNTQYFDNYEFFSNPNEVRTTENLQTSQNTEKQPRGNKWDVAEDIALMSAWCIASGNSSRGKNQKKTSLWARVKELYAEAQAENPGKIGNRNEDAMRGRCKRLSKNAQKWVGAYQEAYRRKRSGMSQKDIENEAHKIYEANGNNKFNDFVVFNEVMCKHPKWALQKDRETTRSHPASEMGNEESGGSTKRSRTTEEGDYSNPETPTSGDTSIQRPTGRDEAKRKGKGKVSNEIAAELRAMRLTRDTEVEVMKKKLDVDQQREQTITDRELMKMQLVHLNTLLQKEHLSAEEENMKGFLMAKFYGN